MRTVSNIRRMIQVVSTLVLSACACLSYAAVAPAGSLISNQADITYDDGITNFNTPSSVASVLVAGVAAGPLTLNKTATSSTGNAVSCSAAASTVAASDLLAANTTIEYSLSLNGGNTAPTPVLYTVASAASPGGAARSGLIVEDVIPANTEFGLSALQSNAPASTTVVVQLADQVGTGNWVDYNYWSTTLAAIPSTEAVAKIGLLAGVNELDDPAKVVSLVFRLATPSAATPGTFIRNTAIVDMAAGADLVSPTVCHVLQPTGGITGSNNDAIIRFLEPRNDIQVANGLPAFANDADFTDTSLYRLDSMPGYNASENGVYLEVRSTSLNSISYTAEGSAGLIIVRLESRTTGDSIEVAMLETGRNSGIFRSLRPITLSTSLTGNGANCPSANYTPQYGIVDTSNCVLKSQSRDTLRATILDPGTTVLVDVAVVDPLGVVFDSTSGALIAGATVSVRELATGQLARDPDTGGATALQPQVTGSDGAYQFPRMFPGQYYLDVISPDSHQVFPSAVNIPDLPAGFTVNQFSYGKDGFDDELAAKRRAAAVVPNAGVFTLSAGDPPLIVDIPLDPFLNPGSVLKLSKGIVIGSATPVGRLEVELGDRVKYQITVSNVGNTPVNNVVVDDVLPFGFKYEQGSAKLDGVAVTPNSIRGGQLLFNAGTIAPSSSKTLTYVLKTTAGAVDSDGINTAVARSGILLSNTAQAQVKVLRSGLLSDRSIVFGKVFIDANCDSIQDNGEWPIGGVRLYMENGTYVTTDENGMYSLYGIQPGQHIIKIDQLTLPTGIKGIPTETRHGADPYSRFVDLYDGEFHRADFVFACPGENAPSVIKQLEARHRSISGDWLLDEAVKFNSETALAQNKSGINARNTAAPAHDGDISSGTIGRKGQSCCEGETVAATAYPHSDLTQQAIPRLKAERTMPITEEIVNDISYDMAKQGTWLWPKDDISYGGRFMVVVRAGVQPDLYVNGQKMNADRLGEQIINKRERAQVMAWYGLPLQVGDNELQIKTKDMFGNDRVMAERRVYHPGQAVNLTLSPEVKSVPADDGRSSIAMRIEASDENGRPAQGIFYVTMEAEHGEWLEQDIQTKNRGFQVKLDNGTALLHLRSSKYIGSVKVKASLGIMQAEQSVDFLPVLRPLIAAGLVDIGVGYSNIDSQGIAPSNQKDGFSDKVEVEGRAAMFLKGKIKGDMLLTLSYDTDKKEEDLFRDIDPNAYYPIYGDSSVRGFDAQSRSKLYVKLEKNKNSIMWGDYQTDSNLHNSSSLGKVNESLTGVNAHYEKENALGKTQLNAFAARKDNLTQFEEIPGRGTATGYRLANFPVKPNSEQISIVTIDRENTQPGTSQGLVLEEKKLERFVDYDLNHLNGFITFFSPVPSIDANGNENFIRVTYQTEQAVDEYTVAGVRATQGLGDSVTVGATASVDQHEQNGYDMASVFAEFKPSDKHRVLAEVATRKNKAGNGEGDAAQLEWKSKWSNKLDTELRVANADEGFKNPIAPIASGRQEARAKARYSLTETTTLNGEVIHSESQTSNVIDQRQSAEASVTQRLGKWAVTGGVKKTERESVSGTTEIDSLTARVDRGFTLLGRNGSVYVGGEHEIGAAKRKQLETGIEYQLQEKLSLYARGEVVDSATNITSLDSNERRVNASLGMKSDWLPSTQLYSEYRLRSAIDSRDLQAVNGVRGDYEVQPKLKFSPSFEIIDTLDGNEQADAYAVSLSLTDNRHKNLRQAIRIETRQADYNDDYYALDYTYAARINLDWSGLYREQFSMDEVKQGEDKMRNLLTLGLARRPLRSNKWHSLYLLQWKEERNIAEDERRAYILSTHQNYQFRKDLTLSGRLASKLQTQVIDGASYDSTAQLLGGRLIWGLNRRWDLDFRLGFLSADVDEDLRYSFGVGTHYLINKNLRFGLGFNFVGFRDDDLDSHKYHAQGVFMGLQYKFDESLFDWLR